MLYSSSSSSAIFPPPLPRTRFSPAARKHKLSFASFPSRKPLKHKLSFVSFPSRKPLNTVVSLRIGVEEILEITRNKVLVAATIASAIGQVTKPFTSALSGKGVELKRLVGSGGMPSTHSAGVVAVATSLGLERGFSDSIFGMSVVFAAIVMYDAQGVRREVGYHAKILNRRTLKIEEISTSSHDEDNSVDSKSGTSSVYSESLAPFLSLTEKTNSYIPSSESISLRISEKTSTGLNATPSSVFMVDDEGPSDKACSNCSPLNESVGHSEIQVIIGALLGFVVSLATEIMM